MIESKLRWIPVRLLTIDPMNVRHDDPSVDEKIIADIRNRGIINPLRVRPLKNGKYGVICGGRRLLAALQLEFEKVPCIVEEYDDIEAYSTSFAENVAVQRPKDWEIIKWVGKFYEMLREKGYTHEKAIETISKKNSLPRNKVENMVTVTECPAEVMMALIKPGEERTKDEKEVIERYLSNSRLTPTSKNISVEVAAKLVELWNKKIINTDKMVQLATSMAAKRLQSKCDTILSLVKKNPKITLEEIELAIRGHQQYKQVTIHFNTDEWNALGNACLNLQENLGKLCKRIILEWLRRNKYL